MQLLEVRHHLPEVLGDGELEGKVFETREANVGGKGMVEECQAVNGGQLVEELRQTIVGIRRFEKTRKWPVTKKISFRQGLHMKMMVLDITANEPAPLGSPEGCPKRVHEWLQFVFSL